MTQQMFGLRITSIITKQQQEEQHEKREDYPPVFFGGNMDLKWIDVKDRMPEEGQKVVVIGWFLGEHGILEVCEFVRGKFLAMDASTIIAFKWFPIPDFDTEHGEVISPEIPDWPKQEEPDGDYVQEYPEDYSLP